MENKESKAYPKEESSYKSIIKFLSYYKKSNDTSTINPEIKKNKTIYTEESSLPELWVKTKCPINKNLIFTDYINQQEEAKNTNIIQKKKPMPNFFPKEPFSLSKYAELNHLNKSTKKDDIKKYEIFAQKLWKISIQKHNKTLELGPFGTPQIKSFLLFKYLSMTEDQIKKDGIMIVDNDTDIHYLPDALFKYFDIEKSKNCGKKDSLAINWNINFIKDNHVDDKKKDAQSKKSLYEKFINIFS